MKRNAASPTSILFLFRTLYTRRMQPSLRPPIAARIPTPSFDTLHMAVQMTIWRLVTAISRGRITYMLSPFVIITPGDIFGRAIVTSAIENEYTSPRIFVKLPNCPAWYVFKRWLNGSWKAAEAGRVKAVNGRVVLWF